MARERAMDVRIRGWLARCLALLVAPGVLVGVMVASGGTALVGAFGHDSGTGAAYVFTRRGA